MTDACAGFGRVVALGGAQRIVFRLHTRSPESLNSVTLSESDFFFGLEHGLLFRNLLLDGLSTSSENALHDTGPELIVFNR